MPPCHEFREIASTGRSKRVLPDQPGSSFRRTSSGSPRSTGAERIRPASAVGSWRAPRPAAAQAVKYGLTAAACRSCAALRGFGARRPGCRDRNRPAARSSAGAAEMLPQLPFSSQKRCQSGGQKQERRPGPDTVRRMTGRLPEAGAVAASGRAPGTNSRRRKSSSAVFLLHARSARRSHPMDQDCFSMVFLPVKTQHGLPGPVQARHDRAGADVQRQRDLLVGKLAVLAHDQHVALAARQAGDGAATMAISSSRPASLSGVRQSTAVHSETGCWGPRVFLRRDLVQAGVAGDAHDPGLGIVGPVCRDSGPAPWRRCPGPGRGHRRHCRQIPGTGRKPCPGRPSRSCHRSSFSWTGNRVDAHRLLDSQHRFLHHTL